MDFNLDKIKGKFDEIGASIQKQWDKLTKEDIAKIKTDAKGFIKILQDKYDLTKEEAEAEFKKIKDKFLK